MAARRAGGTRSETIRCPYCGEDYAASYKHCPFCDELPPEDDYEDEETYVPRSRRGGKRLMTNTRGGGYGGRPSPGRVIGAVISLAVIVAAVVIVITQLVPLLNGDGETQTSPPPSQSLTPGTDAPADTTSPAVTPTAAQPDNSAAPPTASGGQSGADLPVSGENAGFTLSISQFAFSDRYPDPVTIRVRFDGEAGGAITWTSSNPEVATVDANGVVSHGAQQGSTTITASLAGGGSQTCLVYNQVTSGSASGAPALSRTDFTLEPGQSFQVTVSGAASTPAWSIADTAVATVSADGTVSHVGAGQTTLTCMVDGQTLTCSVRCN